MANPTYSHDPSNIDSDRVPYDDLQRSPSPISGRFESIYNKGTLTICTRDKCVLKPAACIHIRVTVRADGSKQTLVSISPFEEDK